MLRYTLLDSTHDPELTSWVESANPLQNDFPIQNLPYATFRKPGDTRARLGVAIGNMLLDATAVFDIPSMLDVMRMPRSERHELRRRISGYLANYTAGAERHLTPISDAELLLPCDIPDYSDFYASIDHATNVGRMFRPDNPLLPNYKWLPVAYHGRASSIILSGTPIHRPRGEIVINPGDPPVYAPTRRLDYELEIGAFLGPGNAMGRPIPIAEAEDHLFGVCLLNDWSARDIQSWEYQPLGPFLGKNFATSISPFVVTLDALEPFRCAPPPRPSSDPQPLPHLAPGYDSAFSITLEVWLRRAGDPEPVRLSRGNFSSMYWTLAQMIAHHTSNGCPLRAGDLIGSGTVSGSDEASRGCLLEMPWLGPDRFLNDGDQVILRGWCEAPGRRRIGLGQNMVTVTTFPDFERANGN